MDFQPLMKNLLCAGYTVREFDTKEEAAAYLDAQIDGKTVGFGGSATLKELGLFELLAAHNTVAWHNRPTEGKTPQELRMEERDAQVYLCSANGVAETGEIVNIDGTCNRVADLSYGHEQVYFVIGENKLAPDFAAALDRARNVAAPLNAKRLGVKTPCAVKGDRCYDCDSPERICRELSVLWRKPGGQSVEVVLVHEKLGF